MRKFLGLSLLMGSTVLAVEVSKPMGQRYSLVGIISETQKNAAGIAVLKDEENQRTLTLRSGEYLPGDTAFQLHRVEKGQVILSDGDAQVILGFSGRSRDDTDAEEKARAEAAQAIAAFTAAMDKQMVEKSVPEKASLSKIIWPGGDDTITFEEIQEENKRYLEEMASDLAQEMREGARQVEENSASPIDSEGVSESDPRFSGH